MSRYRLYYFVPHQHGIVLFLEIEALDDAIAISKAREERGHYALELWCGTRKVIDIAATDIASMLLAATTAAYEKRQDPAQVVAGR